ncbi:MAG TPA: MarR family transcriptional regulator [Candidatus Izemoplasmatales bacterium]|nr:MarR family transcriptional regulator [Candidatus Izemoplasmatales bacterium]
MDDHLKLENQLCFKYYVISKEIIRQYKPLLRPLHLTYTAYITMLALWEEDHVTVKKLGERLTLDSGTLTPLLKKLEKTGYINRHRSKADERQVKVLVTKRGLLLKDKARDIPQQIVKKIFGNQSLSDHEIKRRIDSLNAAFNLIKKK